MSHLVVGIGPGSTAEQCFTNRYRGVEPESMPPSSALSSQISCPNLEQRATVLASASVRCTDSTFERLPPSTCIRPPRAGSEQEPYEIERDFQDSPPRQGLFRSHVDQLVARVKGCPLGVAPRVKPYPQRQGSKAKAITANVEIYSHMGAAQVQPSPGPHNRTWARPLEFVDLCILRFPTTNVQ